MSHFVRRDFLRTVAGAATLPSGAANAAGKIRVAVLGTQHGHLRGKLRAMLDSPDYDFVGLCENNAALRKKRKSEDLYRDLPWLSEEDLLADPAIQLVVVEGSISEAIPLGRKVIGAGKHLHLEKPPSNEWAPFRELVEEARSKKLLLQMGYIWRFHEGINLAIQAARNGWLGDVYLLKGTINTDLGPRSREMVGRYKGGIMFELGCHLIDRVIDLFGRPQEVQSWLRHDSRLDDRLADNTVAILEYDRALAVVFSAARMPGHTQHRSFELTGTNGSILIQPLEPVPRMRVSMRQAQGPYQQGWQEKTLPQQPRYVGDFKEMARALKSKQPLKYSYDFELLLQETLLKASGEMT